MTQKRLPSLAGDGNQGAALQLAVTDSSAADSCGGDFYAVALLPGVRRFQERTRNLPGNGTPLHHPGGFLRHLLGDMPPAPEPEAAPAPEQAPAPIGGRLSARLTGTRECEGHHNQATLFRPTGEELLCPECTARTTPPA